MVSSTIASRITNTIIDVQDDLFHTITDDPSWSESYYFYYFDEEQEIGGITRMGFRANDGWKDYMHIVFLKGRRIIFCYDRVDMSKNDENLS